MHAWILTTGEYNEGSEVRGLFATKRAARTRFLKYVLGMPFPLDSNPESINWMDNEDATISAYCDYVLLTRYEVED